MSSVRILIVDDEDKIRQLIKIYLQKEGYQVDEARDGKEALEKIYSQSFSLLLLDVMLPEVDGWSLCRKVREISKVSIIMLTARSEEYDKLFGFELGIDDYITKPFSPKEMVARIKAVLRRMSAISQNQSSSAAIFKGILEIRPLSRRVFAADEEMLLTPKEFDLLYFLVQNPEIVFSRTQLLNSVWGYDFTGDSRTVDTHIKQLREKLGTFKAYIQTVWGTGYKLKVEHDYE